MHVTEAYSVKFPAASDTQVTELFPPVIPNEFWAVVAQAASVYWVTEPAEATAKIMDKTKMRDKTRMVTGVEVGRKERGGRVGANTKEPLIINTLY